MEEAKNLFIEKYGTPRPWECPDCGILFDIYPALPFDHLCSTKIRYAPKMVYYFGVLDTVSRRAKFYMTGEGDPNQSVMTFMPNGEVVKWQKYQEGDLISFQGPPDSDMSHGWHWNYDKRLQVAYPMPDHQVAKIALSGRVSA